MTDEHPDRGGVALRATAIREIANGGLTIDELGPDGGTCLVRLKGELDVASAPALESKLQRLLSIEDLRSVTLDVAELEFIDSTGLQCLLRAARAATGSRRVLQIRRPQGQLKHVLQLTGLQEALPIASQE